MSAEEARGGAGVVEEVFDDRFGIACAGNSAGEGSGALANEHVDGLMDSFENLKKHVAEEDVGMTAATEQELQSSPATHWLSPWRWDPCSRFPL